MTTARPFRDIAVSITREWRETYGGPKTPVSMVSLIEAAITQAVREALENSGKNIICTNCGFSSPLWIDPNASKDPLNAHYKVCPARDA